MGFLDFIDDKISSRTIPPAEVHGRILPYPQCSPFRDTLTSGETVYISIDEVNQRHAQTKRRGLPWKQNKHKQTQMIPTERNQPLHISTGTRTLGRVATNRLKGQIERDCGHRPNSITNHWDDLGNEFFKIVFNEPVERYAPPARNGKWQSQNTLHLYK